jgi:hypothetical protein
MMRLSPALDECVCKVCSIGVFPDGDDLLVALYGDPAAVLRAEVSDLELV